MRKQSWRPGSREGFGRTGGTLHYRKEDRSELLTKKSSRKMYFSTLLVGLMFREVFFNTQMND
ncbi:MAG: hypothetical protein DMG17_03100 [Acidobacteria bacterium]|nr:MAG: hypothetical protein AUH28_17620 [Acidobacteria bacterium 13_1_40CM_56_16]OLD71742.1 MAG: hypothetical protein AUI45_00865 [Acidobacteria bacterium 13_1_40CM_2_56_11]PYS19252.1 MAG: hypothetical protein DMG17_03100 [Acidobacteriota bacterium]